MSIETIPEANYLDGIQTNELNKGFDNGSSEEVTEFNYNVEENTELSLLWEKINLILQKIENIQLTPGPEGKRGLTGLTGKNGKDGVVDYSLVDTKIKQAIGEIKQPDSPVVVSDISLKNRDMTVFYTDGSKKTIKLPIYSMGGGGGSSYQSAGIDFSSYEEITALDNDDYMLINRGGSLKKIKVSNAGDYLNVMVGDDFVVSNGQYVVVP